MANWRGWTEKTKNKKKKKQRQKAPEGIMLLVWCVDIFVPQHLIHEHTWSRGRLVISLIGCNKVDPVHDAVVWVAMLAFVVCKNPLPTALPAVHSLLLLWWLASCCYFCRYSSCCCCYRTRRRRRRRCFCCDELGTAVRPVVSPVSSVNQLQPDPACARIRSLVVNSLKRAKNRLSDEPW